MRTKERILREALRLFSQKGYDAVSVEQIADAVGIKAPSLYKHYKSKQDIFDAIFEETAKRYGAFTDSISVHLGDSGQDLSVFRAITADALVEKVRFDALFTFIFSPRPGTPAAKLPDPVPREEKQKWFDRLCAVQNGISEELHRQYVGQTLRCLVDGVSDDARWQLTARTAGGRLVHCTGDKNAVGEYRNVKITDSNTWALFGEVE